MKDRTKAINDAIWRERQTANELLKEGCVEKAAKHRKYADEMEAELVSLVKQVNAYQSSTNPKINLTLENQAKEALVMANIECVKFPNESHCDQCDLQAYCDILHDRSTRYSDCKAYPKVYKLPVNHKLHRQA